MSLLQEGGLIRLLAHAWLRGSIPADENSIRALLKNPDGSAMAELMAMVKLCWVPVPKDPSRLVNERQEKEREKYLKFAKERSEAGRKGAKSKWGNRVTRDGSANGSANGSAIVLPMAKDGSSSSSSSSSSNRREDEVAKPLPPGEINTDFLEGWEFAGLAEKFQTDAFRQSLLEFLSNLRVKKRYPTPLSWRKQLAFLSTLDVPTAQGLVDTAVRNGYLGIQEPKSNGQSPSKTPRPKLPNKTVVYGER